MDIPAVESRIRSVTVFSCGARVTREGHLKPIDGSVPERVRFTNLPLTLQDDSLRVSVEPLDGGQPSVVASDLRVALEVARMDESLPPPVDEELREARREAARIVDRLAQIGEQQERIMVLDPPKRPKPKEGDPPLPSPVSARLALLGFRQEESARLAEEREALEEKKRRADEKLADLETKHRRATTARQAREQELRKSVIVSLRGNGNGAGGRLVLEYNVPGARWSPSYVVAFNRELTRAELSMRVLVAQRSGEDWMGVDLTLSTADPQRWTDLPELNSIRIGRRQPSRVKTGWRPPPTGTEGLFADFDRAFPSARKKRGEARTVVHKRTQTRVEAVPAHLCEPDIVMGLLGIDPDELSALGRNGFLQEIRSGGELLYSRDEVNGLNAQFRADPGFKRSAMSAELLAGAGTQEAMMDLAELEEAAPTRSASVSFERSESALFAGGAPAPAPMAVPAAAPEPKAKRMGKLRQAAPMAAVSRVRQSTLGGGPPTVPAISVVHESDETMRASERHLTYGSLHMPGPGDHGRGVLRPADEIETYMELLVQLHVEVSFDVRVAITQARKRAETIRDLPLPPNHSYPSTKAGFDYAYRAEAPIELPSDGQFHSLPLFTRNVDAHRLYVTVPREAQDVFRFAELVNPLEGILPDGPADVLAGGDFLLTTPLRDVAPGGLVRLGLGVEQALKVARNTTFEEQASGLMGGWLNLKHGIRVELTNHLSEAVEVEVRERIPVKSEEEKEDLEVEVSGVSPPWESYSPDDQPALKGAYVWRVSVPPQETKQLKADYSVRIASKHELSGGNRRED